MFGFRDKTDTLKRLFIAFTAVFFIFTITTCDMPMGLGDPIDWEPPVLTLVPKVPNPMFVGLGTKLTGTVYDNGTVDRVIMRDSVTGKELFRARLSGNNWEIVMSFTEAQNGEKIAAEIVAYDKFGNSGDASIASITLIVDIRKPVINDIWIQRTKLRTHDLEPYLDLFALESRDPKGERSANVNRYQNGSFYIYATISEDETRIELSKGVTLNIYEQDEPNVPLYSIEKDSSTSAFSPRWLIQEDEILDRGEARHPGYRTRYNDGERFYYRVEVVAYDRSNNQSGGLPQNYVEDHGFFVLWKTADSPKGVLDPMVAGPNADDTVIATRGSTLPVEFFDDDNIKWAYAGLLTEKQWNGEKPVSEYLTISGASDEAKLEWLRTRLQAGDEIYNWRYDIYSDAPNQTIKTSEKIENQITTSAGLDEKIYYVQTGNNDSDNGEFVLFTLIGDRKLEPHPTDGSLDLHSCRAYKVSVVDENAPMIVFDIQGGSPEENTFPSLTDGRYFTIKGYTLRAINSSVNTDVKRVTRFRMAWIPYYINDRKPDEVIEEVQRQLAEDVPVFINNLSGVQWWDFGDLGFEFGSGAIGTDDPIGGQNYRRQTFYKTFDVLGGSAADPTDGIQLMGSGLGGDPAIILRNAKARVAPDINDPDLPYIRNEPHFIYNTNDVDHLENETKLFVFFAEDNMDHKVYRQIRLLGNKAPPTINVYDITGRTVSGLTPPDINVYINADSDSGGIITPAVRAAYQAALKTYQSSGYSIIQPLISGFGLGENDRTHALQAYPRGTTLKYWIMAQKIDDLHGVSIESIRMQDISNTTPVDAGHYNGSDALSYCEALPEVTQRTFLFTATDTLGNVARIQRTVTITNAAVLTEINTVSQSGTYGIGQTITLRAVFSNQVYWIGNGNTPQLILNYIRNGVREVVQLQTNTPANTPTLFLEFPFVVAAGDSGVLKTMYNDPNLLEAPTSLVWSDVVNNMRNRPIRFPGSNNDHASSAPHSNCSHIYDAERNDNAFTPGNVSGFDWVTGSGSLQASKTITLDGTAPTVTGFSLTGNTGGGTFYYKTDGTISFTLTASEPIETAAGSINSSSIPRIRFQITPPGSTTPGTAYYYATWERSSGSNGMIFSTTVATTHPDGTIVNPALNYDNGRITDVNGNALAVGSDIASYLSTTVLRIDKTAPPVPVPTLGGGPSGTPQAAPTTYYNYNPTLVIPNAPTTASEPWGVAYVQYSLNNGLGWGQYYPTPRTATTGSTVQTSGEITINEGTHTLRTRYVDHAGNITVTPSSHIININPTFPRMTSVAAENPNGTYTSGTLTFNLVFADLVHTQGATGTPNVTITLTNRAANNNNNPGPNGTITNSYTVTLNATAIPTNTPTNTVSFTFPVTDKEMLNGLYISNINLSGLRDRYNNVGPNIGIIGLNANIPTYTNPTVANLNGAGIIVDCIAPRVTGMDPVNMVVSPGTDRTGDITTSVMAVGATTLTLTFNEPVQAGSGTITVKPHGQFLIPPVFENDNYYLNVSTGARSPNSSAGATLIKGFYEIYNSALLNATDRTTLTAEWSVISSNGDARSGQSTGPYIKMTQGLKAGLGYTGNYGTTTGANGPNPEANFMIPDTSTKWVLDYRYSINNSQNTQYVPSTTGDPALANADTNVVTNIRNVLTKAKYRWQEMDVSAATTISGMTVTITLNEPLERGLQWDICYPAGTFTDAAGNNAPAVNYTGNTIVGQGVNASTHWFWSGGVQTPVIRVNRKSFDARTQNWSSNAAATRRYNVPTDRNGPGGWGINDFNTVHYRIETETPNARIYRGTINGRTLTNEIGSAYLSTSTTPADAWSLTTAVPGGDGNWDAAGQTNGTWVRPNLIRRGGAAAGSYTVQENGFTVTRSIVTNTYLFRSYNKDATAADLDGVNLNTGQIDSPVSSGTELNFTYYTTEARKDYVVARAAVNHDGTYPASNAATGIYISGRGYEGVFRSVVAMTLYSSTGQGAVTIETYTENSTLTNGRFLTAEGSNIKNGMPSIAGFPVRDAEEQGDNRFVKTFYRAGNNTANQFYWVSTEIVSQWYFLKWGGNGTHQNSGEANNYFTAGYGDLTFGRLVR